MKLKDKITLGVIAVLAVSTYAEQVKSYNLLMRICKDWERIAKGLDDENIMLRNELDRLRV